MRMMVFNYIQRFLAFNKNGCWFLSNTFFFIYWYNHIHIYTYISFKTCYFDELQVYFCNFKKPCHLGWTLLVYDVLLFLYMFRFNLLKLYLEFLHISLWGKLTIFGIFTGLGIWIMLFSWTKRGITLFSSIFWENIYLYICIYVYFFLTYLVDFISEVMWVESFLSGIDFKHKVNFFIRHRTTLVIFFFLRLICVF